VLYRELADVERRTNNLDGALEHLRQAAALDSGDSGSLVQIGDILERRGDPEGAEQAYVAALRIDPSPDVESKLATVRERIALARLPEEYRAIGDATQITRADLAALIGVRLTSTVHSDRPEQAVVITDIRTSWAAPWIMSVARAGIMEPFANHTFQPRAPVRRSDLAHAISRLLSRLVEAGRSDVTAWTSARLKFSDPGPGHLAYVSASQAVASGAMTIGADNGFQPSRPVSGAEAIAAVGRIEALTPGQPMRPGGER